MPEYERNPPLELAGLDADPAVEFSRWLQAATDAGLHEPTAMALATADRAGQPSVRMVLFKGLDESGALTFATNLKSRKGMELSENACAAGVFWWDVLERQVRVEGKCERLMPEEDRRLFYARARASQIAAITSRQSRPVASREELEARYQHNQRRIGDSEVPMTPDWGGFRLDPDCWEFWQGRRARLHDRVRYRNDGTGWTVDQLEP